MRLYFIDYENVGSAGLKGVSKISSDDKVFLFFTKNNNKFDISILDEIVKVYNRFNKFSVVSGKNSLDMQLSSYLGAMAEKYPDADFFIVSKDNDFNSVVNFWKGRAKKISRVDGFSAVLGGESAEADVSADGENIGVDEKITADLKDYPPETIAKVIKFIKQYKTKSGLNNALCKEFGNSVTAEINKIIKPYIKDKKGN